MKHESLFTRLSKYASSSQVRPLENFSSELLAWVVNDDENAGRAIASLFLPKGEQPTIATAQTQRSIPHGFIDVWLNTTTSSGKNYEVLIENKVDAAFGQRIASDEESGDQVVVQQVDLYLRYAARRGADVRVALLTKRPLPYDPPPEFGGYWLGAVSWHTVDRTLVSLENHSPVLKFLVNQLHNFFVEQEMTLESVEENPGPGTHQRVRLLRLFEEAATRIAVEVGVSARSASGDKWGFYLDFKDSRDWIGGLAYSDYQGDTALYLKYDRFGTDDVFHALREKQDLADLEPRKTGRFWDCAYLPLPILSPEFIALDAEAQVHEIVRKVAPKLKAIVDACTEHDF